VSDETLREQIKRVRRWKYYESAYPDAARDADMLAVCAAAESTLPHPAPAAAERPLSEELRSEALALRLPPSWAEKVLDLERQLAEAREEIERITAQRDAIAENLSEHMEEISRLRSRPAVDVECRSVFPEWMRDLPMQQQSVLLLAARGPDGIAKAHPCKEIVRAYRATVLLAARYGRALEYGEKADTFMSLDVFASDEAWQQAVYAFFDHADSLPHHYLMHLMHGAQILGYKHPDERFGVRWLALYTALCEDLHLHPESEAEMDERLGDWGREDWGQPPCAALAEREETR
jgi:hypothetical protein